jgi:prolyl oligopeptidase PreP (S9A serine peptidase family)
LLREGCTQDILKVYGLDGSFLQEIPLPMPGTIAEITGRKRDDQFFFKFTSFLLPRYFHLLLPRLE